jgi:hypothetical protein
MSQTALKDEIVREIKSLPASQAKEVLDFICFVKHKETLSRIDPTQAYFYTPKWKKSELAAEKDIKAGRVSESYAGYETDRLFADLKKGKRKAGK